MGGLTPSYPVALLRAVSSEALKAKRTLALASALLLPLLVAFLQFAIYLSNPRHTPKGANPWELMGNVTGLYCVLMLPLLTTLVSALLFGLEHQNGGFRNLYARPLPRSAFHVAKLALLAALLALSFVVLVLAVLAAGAVLLVVRPGLEGAPRLVPLLTASGASLAASLPMLVLAAWVAGRFPSFTVASATGIAATVAGFVVANSARWVYFYPHMLPAAALRLLAKSQTPPPYGLTSFLVSVVAAGLLLAVVSTRDVARLPR